ncbi:MAG: anthranilate synthase component I [Bacillota bacterium]
MYKPRRDEFVELSEEGDLVPIYKELSADLETPVSAFMKLGDKDYSYLLESVEQGQQVGRYSFIGIDYHGVVSCKDDQFQVRDKTGRVITNKKTANPVADLEDVLEQYQAVEVDDLPLFYGGAVGYLGYDVIQYFENIPQTNLDDLEVPEMLFVLSDTVLIFDHLHHNMKVVTNVKVGDNPEEDYQRGLEKIEEVIKKLEQPVPNPKEQQFGDEELTAHSNMSKKEFINSIQQIKDYIRQGDIFQTVFSQRLEVPISSDSFSIYRQLRRLNPSPYMYYLNFADFELVGSSPELLVRAQGEEVETRPIAGTRKRGANPQEDQELAQDLLADEKERAEHTMLVDLGRNDLGRVSKYGTVDITELMEVEYYSHVMHLVSNVEGKLSDDDDIYSALEACFPAGTVSGAPKIRAMEIIDELEPTKRGPYAGSIGYFSYSGNLDSCITIRTILTKDDKAYVQAGAGIVADSDPESEYHETLNKASALLEAVRLAEGGGELDFSN